ncbi:hypothetical protein ACHAW6_008370 [Cyclotella cf. meneghiniana]
MKAKPTLYHGHLVLLSTFILNFVGIGTFLSAGIYMAPLSETFPQVGSGTLALYCSVQILTGLVSSSVGGIAEDLLESKGLGVQWLFFGGGVFMALGLFWSSVSQRFSGVLVGSVVTGIGLGFGGLMAGGIAVLWFEALRGQMLLLAMSGQGIGNVFFAWATSRVLEINEGVVQDPWRPTMRWIGALCLVLCTIASVNMRMPLTGEVEEYERESMTINEKEDRPLAGSTYGSLQSMSQTKNPRRRSSIGTEIKKSCALALDQIRRDSGDHFQVMLRKDRRRSSALGSFQAIGATPVITLADFEDHDTIVDSLRSMLGEAPEENVHSLKDLTMSRTHMYLNAFTFISCFALLNMQVLLPPYIKSIGMSSSLVKYALAMFGVGNFLSNLTLGGVADRFGASRLLAFAFVILSILFFIWPHCTTIASLSAVAFAYGYFSCTIVSMPVIILANAFSDSSSEHIQH